MNNQMLDQNDIIIKTKTKSIKKQCNDIGNKKRWIRKCPDCKRKVFYCTRYVRDRVERKHSLCLSCCRKGHRNPHKRSSEKERTRFCPQCKKSITYNRRCGRNAAEKYKRLCQSCTNRIISLTRIYPEETRRKLKGRKRSFEVRRKIRLGHIKRISKNEFNGYQMTPNYNPKACKFIEEYGKQNGYNFQHAMNGGEFYIEELGYWVDGYDKEKNVVIEYDESHHKRQKEKDNQRMTEIKEYLRCKFIRYNERLNEIKKYY